MKNNIDLNKLCPVIKGKLSSSSNNIIPVIICYKPGAKIKEGQISSLSKRLKHELPIINGCACEMATEGILKLTSDPDVEFISYDSKVFAVLDVARKTIGADYTLNTSYTGKDVTVAIIDTGVAPHTDLIYPSNRIIGFKDFVNKQSKFYDDNGHGTHAPYLIYQIIIINKKDIVYNTISSNKYL